jgi:hypothetical protein
MHPEVVGWHLQDLRFRRKLLHEGIYDLVHRLPRFFAGFGSVGSNTPVFAQSLPVPGNQLAFFVEAKTFPNSLGCLPIGLRVDTTLAVTTASRDYEAGSPPPS